VPDGYDHDLQVEVFKKNTQDNFGKIIILDEHHKNIDDKIIPGAAYIASIFRIGKGIDHYRYPGRNDDYNYIVSVKIQNCVDFLEKESSLFVGAQGVSFIWQFINKEKLKNRCPIIAFDSSTNSAGWYSLFGVDDGRGYTIETIDHGGWDPGVYLLSLRRISEDTFNKSELRKHEKTIFEYRDFLKSNKEANPDASNTSKIIWERDNDIENVPKNILAKTDTVFQIPFTDGKKNISNSKENFRIIFFEEEEINKSDFISKDTISIDARVYSLIKNSTIYKMFKSLNKDLSKLCFTQAQILMFLSEHRNELVGTWHFMYKAEDGYMFMQVCMDNDGSMRLFGGDFTAEGLDNVYKATGVNFRFLIPEK
jgi:hypothetical protein